MTEPQEVPLKARIHLSHAYFQKLTERNAIDILHIKGYAFGSDCYVAGRHSSDVDVLVRPSDVDRFMYLLVEDGWKIVTTFESGSIFNHASTVYHPMWGLADIHRYFPGLGYDDQAKAFEQLWSNRRYKEISHVPCAVPSLLDSRLLVVIHDGRNLAAGRTDTAYLRSFLSEDDWDQMRSRAQELEAELAFDAALSQIDMHRGEPYYLLWKSMSEDVPPYIGWLGRLQREKSLAGKAKVLKNIFIVNNDHLAMELGHQPSRAEVRAKFYGRFVALFKGGK